MFKRTILLASLPAVVAVSVVLVVAAARTSPRGADDGLPSSGSVQPDAGVTAGAKEPVGPEVPQGVGFNDIQARIRASDEEWKVIGPKLRRLMMAYAAAEASLDGSSTGGTEGPGFAPLGRGGGSPIARDRDGEPGPGGPGGPGENSFSGPGDRGGFGRGGPGPGGFGPSGPGPDGFGPGGSGPEGFGSGRGGFGRGGRGPGGFARGGPGPGGGPPGFGGPGGSAVTRKLAELRTALADPNTASEQLKEKIDAVRDARLKAKAELAAAREDLRELLTPDQEAVLVSLDYLD